jgi:hypothetical protein
MSIGQGAVTAKPWRWMPVGTYWVCTGSYGAGLVMG